MQRNQSLDVLRCVAVLLVVAFHFPHYSIWGRVGWIGVDLFFVLSGFLISGLLFQEYKITGSINFKRFILRRCLKIWPSFYLLLIVATGFCLMKASGISLGQIFYNFIWLQNYHEFNSLILIHTWSLAVEEHFYLFLPALLGLLMTLRKHHNPFRAIPALFVFLAGLCLSFRWLQLTTDRGTAVATHMRMDSLFAGVALGYLFHFRNNWFQKLTGHYALALAFILCVPAALFRGRAIVTLGPTALFLGFAFLVAWAVVRTPEASGFPILGRYAAQIGFYSYSIYLWHTTVLYFVTTYFGWSAIAFWIYMVGAIIVGIATSHVVELPFLALRQKLFPAPAKEPVLAVISVRAPIPQVDATGIVL